MAGEGVRLEARDGLVARIRLDRPPVNVLSVADLDSLAEAVAAATDVSSAGGAPPAQVLVLGGLSRAFSAGIEVAEHAPDPPAIERMLAAMRAAVAALTDTTAVTVAEVSGACLGGGAELAAACDFVYCSEDARIGFPEIRLACFPPAGAVLLPLRIGASRAAEWILSGRSVSGREAAAAGFATRALPAGVLRAETDRSARELASRSSAALAGALSLLRAARREALLPGGPLARAEDAYRRLAHDPDLARAVAEFRPGVPGVAATPGRAPASLR